MAYTAITTARDKNPQRVNYTHPTYDMNQPKRDLYAAVIGGTDGVRAGTTAYLPMYPAEDAGEYTARLHASTIDGVVCVGRDGLVGKVFHEEPDTSGVNTSIIPLLENIDLEGNHFNVFTREAFAEAFAGYSVILVDVPKAAAPVQSLEEQQTLGIRPYWRIYTASNVVNWRWVVDDMTKQTRLALLVLKECPEVPDGEFGMKTAERYRVYRHETTVTQELWEKRSDLANQGGEFFQTMAPITMATDAIPVGIIGELEIEPWLLNESRLEIKAYQKESSFDVIEYLSIPVFYTIGYDKEDPIPLGASTHIRLPNPGQGGTAEVGYAQIDSSGHESLKASIDSIKQEIAGRLDAITKEAMPMAGGDETATEVVSDDSKSQARLVVWSQQLTDAVERALQFTAQFMGLGADNGGEVAFRTAWAVAKEKAIQAQETQALRDEAEIAATKAKATPPKQV